MAAQTFLFPCLTDNFGVLLHDPATGATASIDAPEAAPIEAALQKTGWRLTDILVTHHHADHTQGIGELTQHHKCRVIAPRHESKPIAHVNETVDEGDTVRVGGLEGRVIATPGHTAGHISYFFPADKLAFVGDTLFSIGCGRVIEGDPEMMWRSLVKLRDLPDDTRIFLRPRIHRRQHPLCQDHRAGNKALNARADEVATRSRPAKLRFRDHRRREGRQPVPARDDPAVAQSVGLAGAPAWKCLPKSANAKTASDAVRRTTSSGCSSSSRTRKAAISARLFATASSSLVGRGRRRAAGRAAATAIYFLLRAASVRTGTASTPWKSGTGTQARRSNWRSPRPTAASSA